jgi:glycosyltransferase involved in cell wall biosynthesis
VKGRVSAVHNGLTPIPEDDTEPVSNLKADSYLLFIGSLNPRKNITRLLDAYERYRDRVDTPLPLVLAGSEQSVFAAVDRPPIDGVRALGFVSDAQRNWLYHNATALLFPSLYEGFGLPIIEAMDCGTPVLTSNTGAMAEVAADAAVLVNPTDADDIASAIERISTDETLRKELVDTGKQRVADFTWASAAKEMIAIYRRVANGKKF